MIELLKQLLAIPSPTFGEERITRRIHDLLKAEVPGIEVESGKDGLLAWYPRSGDEPALPRVALVGHSDVVPAHFEPYEESGRLHGSGASDMKAALAVYIELFRREGKRLRAKGLDPCLVIYTREENTPLDVNGLNHLIRNHPDFFRAIDLAMVGEPTDNTIQIGCVGSVHAEVRIEGQEAHSARPWHGENALNRAADVLVRFRDLAPIRHSVFGVDFYDVAEVTETETPRGKTTLPGYWWANVNYRFSPVYTEEQAHERLAGWFREAGLEDGEWKITSSVPAAKVVESDLFREVVGELGHPVQAKQAWTDVAQLAQLEIAAFNFGPGLTTQAHKNNEYVMISDCERYYEDLIRLFVGEAK